MDGGSRSATIRVRTNLSQVRSPVKYLVREVPAALTAGQPMPSSVCVLRSGEWCQVELALSGGVADRLDQEGDVAVVDAGDGVA